MSREPESQRNVVPRSCPECMSEQNEFGFVFESQKLGWEVVRAAWQP